MNEPTEADRIEKLLDTPNLADALESDRFKQFLDHVPVAIAVSELRPSEAIVYANFEFERLTGRSARDIQGEDWNVLPGMASAQNEDEKLSHAVELGEEYVGRFSIVLEDRRFEVDAWSNTIQDDDGVDTFRLVALAEVGHDRPDQSELAKSLRDKDGLLLELQHRVKNNLQMITALIRMEARNVTEEDAGERFDRLAGRINALSVLYDCLASQGRSDNESIDLGTYLSQIASSVMQAHAVEGIRLDLTVDTWPVSINVAMPAGLVVNELMTNALKHAFVGREGGTIRMHSLVDETGCFITIADDGVGLPEGVSWPKPGKLGAAIAQSLRQNAGATLTVNSKPGEGTEVILFFARPAVAPQQNYLSDRR
jgi:two-component sensor histidine kinase